MDNKKVIDINYKKNLKKYVYSIRINKSQRELLVKNDWIKKDLDKLVRDYLNNYLQDLRKYRQHNKLIVKL